MDLIELLIIALGVSMDAFAVSICKGLSVCRLRPAHVLSTGLWFGGFQALMPLIGYFVGYSFADFVTSVDHWIAFLLLGIIGGNMLKESFHKDDCHCDLEPDFSFRTMLALAVATSIDALADAVDNGVIAGAGLDVFAAEPLPLDHPYLHMKHPERMSLAPHVAWASVEARTRLVSMIADNIAKGW